MADAVKPDLGPSHEPRQIVVTNGALQLQQCSLYVHHTAILHTHHVCPESWWVAAGKPVDSPLLELCPNCHYDIHAGIDSIIGGVSIGALSLRAQKMARAAFPIAEANGLTPKRTL